MEMSYVLIGNLIFKVRILSDLAASGMVASATAGAASRIYLIKIIIRVI